MADNAKTSMLLCSLLEHAEQEKVDRLDGEISERFSRAGAGHVVRLCRGRGDGDSRMLDFCTNLLGTTVVATLSAREFVAASDAEACAMIAR